MAERVPPRLQQFTPRGLAAGHSRGSRPTGGGAPTKETTTEAEWDTSSLDSMSGSVCGVRRDQPRGSTLLQLVRISPSVPLPWLRHGSASP